MKFKILCLFLAGVLLGSFVTYLRAATAEPVIVREFATDYGPIRLTFRGDAVTGTYRISVKPQPDEGDITGTIRDGLLDATWSEPRSRGRMLIGFSADFSRLHALYSHDARPGNWEGEWTGVNLEHLASVPAGLRNRMRADWAPAPPPPR